MYLDIRAHKSRRAGRPRAVVLTDEERALVARRIAAANLGRGAVSATAGARAAAEEIPALADALARRADKHCLPTEVREIARRVRAVTPVARDARNLRNLGGAAGHLRRHWSENRRLRAGEQFSLDDCTINIAVVVPWPIGGCRCSDRYGVRVGRFQLILAHDDATGYVPAYVYQIREAQSYRAADAASLINGLCRDVCRPGRLVLEGGVWQKERVKAILGTLGIITGDAKGRPNCKLVEGWINKLWTQLAMELPTADLARFRGETVAVSNLYMDCRAGRKDPRGIFPPLPDVLAALDASISRLNNEVIQSRQYGSWIPSQRWYEDLEAWPRPAVTPAEVPLWTSAPVLEHRTVRGAKVIVTAPGPFGVKIQYHFGAPALWDLERQTVRVAFDPQTAGQTGATILRADAPRIICTASCLTAQAGVGADTAGRVNHAIRSLVRREYRVLLPDAATGQTTVTRRETEVSITTGAEPGRQVAAAPERANGDRGHRLDGGREKTKKLWTPAHRDLRAEIAADEILLRDRGQLSPLTEP